MSVPSEDGAYGEDLPLDPLAIELPASVDGEGAEERGAMSPRSAPTSVIGDEVRHFREVEQGEILEEGILPIAQVPVAQAENAGDDNAHGEEPSHNFRQGQRNSGGSAVFSEDDIHYPPPPPPGSSFPGNGGQFAGEEGYQPPPQRRASVNAAAAEGNGTDMPFKIDSQGYIDLDHAHRVINNLRDLGGAQEMLADALNAVNDYLAGIMAERDSARQAHEDIELQCIRAEATNEEWE